MGWYNVKPLFPGVYQVMEGQIVSFFLILGSRQSVLIDTGFGLKDVREIIRPFLTNEPMVVNTHVHPDHSNGNGYFSRTTMGQVEWEEHGLKWNNSTPRILSGDWVPSAFFETVGVKTRLFADFEPRRYDLFIANGLPVPVHLWKEGDEIDLWDTVIEVFHMPAHTRGSLCLLDRRRRILFAGDTLSKGGPWWLHLKCRATMEVCFHTYSRLALLAEKVDHILPAHGEPVLPGDFLTEIARKMESVRRSDIRGETVENYGGRGYYYDFGGYGPVFAESVAV